MSSCIIYPFYILLTFCIMPLSYTSSYSGIATCKSCTTLSSCGGNNCIYLTGGSYINKQYQCAEDYGLQNCQIGTASYTVTNQCVSLGCQYCCLKINNSNNLSCVDFQFRDICVFTSSETNGLSMGIIVAIIIGGVVVLIAAVLLVVKCEICAKNTPDSNENKNKYKSKQKQLNKQHANSATNIIAT